MNAIAGPSFDHFKTRRRPPFRAHVLRDVRCYVDAHLDEKVTSGMLARQVHLSTSYFCQSFKVTFGQTLTHYLRTLRLERACQLMTETQKTLIEIAHQCGMNDQAYLCRCFRERFGMPPSQWRRDTLAKKEQIVDD